MSLAGLEIRLATREDVPDVVRLLHEDTLGGRLERFQLPVPPSYFEAFQAIAADPNNELVVAALAGQVVGTFQMTLMTYMSYEGARVLQLESVHVAAEFRNQGIGQAMMKWAIARARQQDCHRIQLTSNKVRKDAHRFYERLGFRSTHEGMKLFFL